MLFANNNRSQLRLLYLQIWEKHQQNQPLETLETMIVEIIREHPEYHRTLEDASALSKDFSPDTSANPFLHMSLHLSLHEQIAADMPKGIRKIASKLLLNSPNRHATEHAMMHCLEKTLAEAMQTHREPDQNIYLQHLKNLLGK